MLQNPCDLSAVGVKLWFSVNLQTSKLSSLMMSGGKAFGTRWCGILGQQVLCGNSEMLHIADLIFAIKGLNLNFRKG